MMMKSAAPAPPSLPRLGVGALVVDPANENYPAPLLFRLISFLYDRACSVPLPFSLMGNTEPDKEREILAVLDIFKGVNE
ncbi:hypothetical protein Pelo_16382 [Pelomyxa schiedti]|nr:hypothetical protein Pelo_16382 [Pelomyxa schiedti]